MQRTIGILTLVALLATVAISADDKPPAVANQQIASPFKAPLIAITLMSDAEDLILLEDARERAIGERRFLVGQGVDDGATADWRNNRQVWVAVDDVQQVVEFDGVDSFRKAIETRKEPGDGKAASVKPRRSLLPPVSHRVLKTK